MQCDAPVIPVAQFGTAAVQPIGAMWPKLFRPVGVKLGAADALGGRRRRIASELRQFTDQMMAAIAALSGQEMVHRYASRDQGRLSAPGSEAEPCAEASCGPPA